jgi:hypothetical protein
VGAITGYIPAMSWLRISALPDLTLPDGSGVREIVATT